MRKFLLLSTVLFFAVSPVASETALDLGDIYIWGEDMSVFEGITTESRLLYPVLAKAAFIEPYSGDLFEKLSPRDMIYPSDGIYLHAGAGSYNEYIMRVVHSAQIKPWSLNWRLTGKQKNIEREDEYNRRMAGFCRIGYRSEYFNGALKLRGSFEDDMPERKFYNMAFKGGIKAGKINLQPSVFYSEGKHFSSGIYQAGAAIKAERDLAYYNSLMFDVETRQSSIDSQKDSFFRTGLNFRSRIFRDFTFSLSGGVASGSEAEYGGYISGEALDTGYRIYYRNSFSYFCLYEIAERKEALLYRNIFSPEKVSRAGVNLYRDLGIAGKGEFGFSAKRFDDKIIYVKNGEGTYTPYNYGKSLDVVTVGAGLRKNPVYISFKYRDSTPRLPFYSETEFNIGADYETPLSFAVLELSGILKHRGRGTIWYDDAGSSTGRYSPSSSLDAGAALRFGSGIFLKTGVENILGEKIITEGFFPEKKTKFYLIGGINLPIKNK